MIRIFVGCSANNEDLEFQAVLEYTIRKHASRPVELTWMKLSRDPSSFWYSSGDGTKGWNPKSWATPFSPFRWGIPAACGYDGKAIYMDIDMWAQADVAELWDQELKGDAVVLAKGKSKAFCCSLWDCAKVKPHLPDVEKIKRDPAVYRELRKRFDQAPGLVQAFEGNWNCWDGEDYRDIDDPDIKVMHCTRIPTQPHLKFATRRLADRGQRHWSIQPMVAHPRADISARFVKLLHEAIDAGYSLDKYESKDTFGPYGR